MNRQVIARREYCSGGGPVEATIALPQSFEDSQESSWFATITFHGLDHEVCQDVGGADAIQALGLACHLIDVIAQSEDLQLLD